LTGRYLVIIPEPVVEAAVKLLVVGEEAVTAVLHLRAV
jgi:hypothetical protein